MENNLITLPGSKSIAARALILKRVFGLDGLRIDNLPDCDDTRELMKALAVYDRRDGHPVEVNPGNGGTSFRFFLALAASTPGFEAVIDCGDQLRRRPLRPLIEALKKAGADIVCSDREFKPPFRVKGARLRGEGLEIEMSQSSQFASALVLVSPLWETPFSLPENPEATSLPYIEMSEKMLRHFRALSDFRSATPYRIEPDWSAAAFYYEYALMHTDEDLTFKQLTFPGRSIQGDSTAAFLFGLLGVDTVYNPDGSATIKGNRAIIERMARSVSPMHFAMNSTPDLVPPMAVSMALTGIRFIMTGVANLRHKESDRLEALRQELSKLGYTLDIRDDSLSWTGRTCEPDANPEFHSHDDHRIAMALAAAGIPARSIRNIACVSKSFPGFSCP